MGEEDAVKTSLTGKLLALLLASVLAASLWVPALAAGTGSLKNFKPQKSYAGQYTDMKQGDFAYEGARICYEYGIMNGTTAKTFSPNQNITQTQLTVIAARLYHIYHGGDGAFPQDLTYWADAGSAAASYLKSELGADNVTPVPFNEPASRWSLGIFAQVLDDAALPAINRLTEIPDYDKIPKYDETKGMEAAVLKLYNAGVLTGSDAYGTFYNSKPITRGAVAAIVARIIDPAQRKTLHLKQGPAPIQGLLLRNFADCPNMMAFHDANPELFADKAVSVFYGDRWVICEDGVWMSICRSSEGYKVERLTSYCFPQAEKQYKLLRAFFQDVTENPEALYQVATEMTRTLEKDRDVATGHISAAAKRWLQENGGKSTTVGNIVFTWDDACEGFTIQPKK